MDDYWFGSGTPTYLINMMRKYEFLPADLGEAIEVGKKDFDAPHRNDDHHRTFALSERVCHHQGI